MKQMKVALVTREWPPQVYGGAGVHVVQLAQALAKKPSIELSIHCFGGERDDAFGYSAPEVFRDANPALAAVATDLLIANALHEVDLVHSHTWYANLAGYLAATMYDIPHIMSAHSLEPLRPWKADQLGAGYRISSWAEKISIESAAAVIAVSDGMRADVLSAYPSVDPNKVVTIRNGVDTVKFFPHLDPSILEKFGITGKYALFVGRITRQKGLAHLLRAWKQVPAEFGLVLAAGSPDEPGIGQEVSDLIAELQASRKNVWWLEKMLPHEELTVLLSSAELFLCPSIYEPLGIVNLEAMGCATAVLASAVGGIPEVVVDGVTGELVPYTPDHPKFEKDFGEAIIRLMSQPELLSRYGAAGRERAQRDFGWDAVATATLNLYASLLP
jgi:starch synthase